MPLIYKLLEKEKNVRHMNNPFVFACIAPHGEEIIPELQGGHPERMEVTRKSLTKLGEKMTKARPDCIIALSPHATRIDKAAKPLDQEVVQLIRADNHLQKSKAIYL